MGYTLWLLKENAYLRGKIRGNMKKLLPNLQMVSRCGMAVLATLLVSACLPGEDDVAKKYNDINQRAHIENTGNSLMQAANNTAGYLTAKSMRRKAPLNEIPLTQFTTVDDNSEPALPPGIGIAKCEGGMLGAMAFFIEQPKGVPPLSQSGQTMMRALSERFGGHMVGWHGSGQTTLPQIVEDVGCEPIDGIVENSPIFAAGFVYGEDNGDPISLPDPNKVTYPTVSRDLTLPCPSGYSGVIQRKQDCKLETDEDGEDAEKVTFKTGKIDVAHVQEGGYELEAVRIKKRWECDESQDVKVPPSASEIAAFCRNNADNMEKPGDNTIPIQLENFKENLETGGTGNYYQVICREGAEGTGLCRNQRYTPPAGWTIKCDNEPQDPRYVVNPTFETTGVRTQPLVDWDNGLITPSGTEVDCGRGWDGDIKWEYQLRQCSLYSPEGVIAPEQPKTIYWMGQVAMKCKREPKPGENWIAECPVGVGDIFIKKRYLMNDFVALKPKSYDKGQASVGEVFVGTADAKTEERLQKDEFKDTSRLCGEVGGPDWDDCNRKTASALNTAGSDKAFSDAIMAAVGSPAMSSIPIACNTEGQTCKTMGDVKHLIILVDRSRSMRGGGGNVSYLTPQCRTQVAHYFDSSNVNAACNIIDNFTPEYAIHTPVDCSTLPPEDQTECYNDNNDFDKNFTEETNALATSLGAQLSGLAKTSQNIESWKRMLQYGIKCSTAWHGGICLRGETVGPQDTCVGNCVSAQVEAVDTTRIDAVNRYITGLIVPSLKKGVKVTYGQIRNKMDWFPFPKTVPDYQIFTHEICRDSTNTVTFMINGKPHTFSWSIYCNLADDQREIQNRIGNDSARHGTPMYGALVDTINEAQREGATGEGTYVMIITDGYPTDRRRDGITGVCAGSKPIYKYIQERMPGSVVNMLLMAPDEQLQSECDRVRSAAGWSFVDSGDLHALSNFMETKFPVYMPELGAPMCSEYFKTNNIAGYMYSE
jgi:hypothetical protein